MSSRANRRKLVCASRFNYKQRMKVGLAFLSGVLLLMGGLLAGCASNSSGPAAATPATHAKGHWMTLPPQTGSLVPRRIWVDESGQANASPSMDNVRNGSAADVQRMQNNSSGFRPPGN
jgi:hypothetical protein